MQNQTQYPGAPAPAAVGANSVLAALGQLASMARQNQNQNAAAPPSSNPNNAHMQAPVLNQSFPPAPSVNQPANFANPSLGFSSGGQNYASNQTNAFPAVPPVMPPAMAATGFDPAVQQQLMLIKTLSDAGVPNDRIAGIVASLGQGALPALPMGAPGGVVPPQFGSQNQIPVPQNGQDSHDHGQNGSQNGWGARLNESRDRNGPDRFERRRSRSPSPSRGWNGGQGSPNSRRRNDHFEPDRSPGRNRDDRGRGDSRGGRPADSYRQRSPARWNRSPIPPRHRGGDEKWIGSDDSLPEGNIKGTLFFNYHQNETKINKSIVLSRTLFVGGVT